MDRNIVDRSTYGLAAGAMIAFALFGLGEMREELSVNEAVSADSRRPEFYAGNAPSAGPVTQALEADDPVFGDPEFPDAGALVLALARLLASR